MDDSLTLGLFDDAKMFAPEHLETLLEIAGQASAEAGLEVLLKKVDDLWKEFELTVTPHRDSKDVFILAGQEDVGCLYLYANKLLLTFFFAYSIATNGFGRK